MAAKITLTDEEFLGIVASERRQSVGFEHDTILLEEREKALNYIKGEMPDLPTMPNRSKAVSTDIDDAIETVLPDLVEIFLSDDDVATFVPNGPQDEQQAEQETDYVNQVVFHENDGFLLLYSFFKDALQVKTGVVKFVWEEHEIEPETFTGKTMMEMQLAAQDGELSDVEQMGVDEQGQPLFNFTLTNEQPNGSVKILSWPPEDFTVARDTVSLRDTTYCAARSRPRAQDLIAMGIDRDVVDDIPAYGSSDDETLTLARDTAGEHADQRNVIGTNDLRTVEVIEHYIRVDAEDAGKPQIWRVLTGGSETILIEKEKVDRIPFAAITPYVVTHRFYGQSVADKLLEPQRVKTALTRMALDSGYFALNQRMEVALEKANQFTISDLLRNEPGLPVRSKTGDAVRPVSAGVLNFNVLEHLEYFSTQAEQRTGIVRNAQGLNPDSLHDTATGAMALMGAAQKRVRLMARVFAETGIKDLFLGVHALLRKHASQEAVKRIRGQWMPVDPSQWAERTQMTIQLGLGSAGRHEELVAMQGILAVQDKIIGLQGNGPGPLVSLENVYNAVTRMAKKSGEKAPEQFFSDPAKAQPQEPKPNPEMLKLQADQQQHADKMQLQTGVEQAKDQRETMRAQSEVAIAQSQARAAAVQAQMQLEEAQARIELDRQKLEAETQFKYAQLAQQRELEMAKIQAQFGQAVTIQSMKDETAAKDRDADLQIQASEAHDAEVMDD
jgi:hypothetical protein